MPIRKEILLGVLMVAAIGYVRAEALVIGGWKNFTNTNDVKGFAYAAGHLWIATTGGLVKFNSVTESREVFTNAEGLGGNFLLSVASDQKGNLWIGADNGTLTKYNLAENRFTAYPFVDRDNRQLKLFAILPDSDRLWVGTDVGVALFLTERNGGEMKEIYRRLGAISTETPVRALALFRDSIWAATSQGVAGAFRNDANLLDFSHWKSFRASPPVGLTNEDSYSLLVFKDTLLVGTSTTVFAFLPDSLRFRIYRQHLTTGFMASLAAYGDTLYSPWQFGLVATVGGSFFDLASDTLYKPGFSRFFPALFVAPTGELFVATAGSGFARWMGTSVNPLYKIYRPPGPPNNYVNDLAVDEFGKLWLANDYWGASMFEGASWTFYDSVPAVGPGPVAERVWAVDIDPSGTKWFSLFSFEGRGAAAASGPGPVSFSAYDTSNSPFRRISSAANLIVVTDVAADYQGNVWFANRALDDRTLVVRMPDDTFEVFGSADGFRSNDINALFADGNHIWIAFNQADTTAGVADFNFNGTLSDRSDDTLIYYNKDRNFLLDNRVTAIAVDKRGTLWAGTGLGLSRFNADFQQFETVPLPQPLGPQVNSIVVDPRNNKWIGTSRGLAVITEEGEIFGPFLSENSGLAAPLINAMAFYPDSGWLWIGTAGGLSRLSTQVLKEARPLAGEEGKPHSGIEAFPNPFILRGGGERVYFRRLPLEAALRIYNSAGEEVRRLKDTDFWDGKNENGEFVASGVYLFLVFERGQERFNGKLAVIRQF